MQPPSILNFNDLIPAAPSGYRNAKWQADSGFPIRNVSDYFSNIGGVDPRTTTTESITIASQGKLVTLSNSGAIAVTLDSTVVNFFICAVLVIGAGAATLTPSSGTINGHANLTLSSGANCWLFFDGVNWKALVNGSFSYVSVPSTVIGDFTIAHGLGVSPKNVDIKITSDGLIRFQPSPSPPWDATNVYLNASTDGLTALLVIEL